MNEQSWRQPQQQSQRPNISYLENLTPENLYEHMMSNPTTGANKLQDVRQQQSQQQQLLLMPQRHSFQGMPPGWTRVEATAAMSAPSVYVVDHVERHAWQVPRSGGALEIMRRRGLS
eukprot:PhM_4_TR7069/c0_g1_i1/m.35609